MDSDDDLQEMRQLRRARDSRPGAIGKGCEFEEGNEVSTTVRSEVAGGGEWEEDANGMLRMNLPLAFGKVEPALPDVMKVHEKFQRGHGKAVDGEKTGVVCDTVKEEYKTPDDESEMEPVKGEPGIEQSEDLGEANESLLGLERDKIKEEDPYDLPITHEAVLVGHSKTVTAIDVDHSGSRVITGSHDYSVHMYDFNGMKSDMRSFRQVEPCEGHPVASVSFSPSGDCFLAVTGAAQAKIYDRDGKSVGEFIRGDMYIRDMRNTKGHVSGLCGGMWHPNDRNTVVTCSEDGTVRLWDTENIEQKVVVKPTLKKPGRVAVTACTYNPDGTMIAGGLRDGSIQIWSTRGKFGRSAAVGQVPAPKAQLIQKQNWSYVTTNSKIVRGAHSADMDISCLKFSKNGHLLLSRALDGTMKLWDIRNFKAPVSVVEDLPNDHSQTTCSFSPDESLAITGVSQQGSCSGYLAVVDLACKEIVRRVDVEGSVVASLWHERLNQILVGGGDRSQGATHVLYSLDKSSRGALLCVGRTPRRKDGMGYNVPRVIHNPHALPMFREPRSQKRQREKDLMDPVKARRPDPGLSVSGVGKGGKVGATGGTLLTQHLLKTRGKMVSVEDEADPREAILRHADKKDAFSLYTAAYNKTQPTPIFADTSNDEDDEHDEDHGKGQEGKS